MYLQLLSVSLSFLIYLLSLTFNCLENLNYETFHLRPLLSLTNISSFNYYDLSSSWKKYCVIIPNTSLIVDTVHLIKYNRNNVIGARFYQIAQLQLELQE